MAGRLYWITGLSGAGKTTIGTRLYHKMRSEHKFVVIYDGDQLRQAFGNDLGYSREERFECAMRYSRLSKLLVEQDVDVICCTISMFDDVRKWNRENILNYTEIYVKVPMEVLKNRNQKKLYSNVEKGFGNNVVGMDLELELPKNPDILIENDGSKSVDEILEEMYAQLSIR